MRGWQLWLATSLLAASFGLSAADPQVPWRGLQLTPVATLATLPIDIQHRLRADAPGTGGIAERGAEFNSTDVIDKPWPMRRFVVAGHDGDTWVVVLEQGGRGYNRSAHVLMADGSHREYAVTRDTQTLAEATAQMQGDGKPSRE
ncbi:MULTISPECIES: hypothetical protein [Dyella]|uniref:Uncharacterized protein n=2 Tax=Dyella TaxID=231454 RepID=A0A4R0YTK4_9GAMM|nr:MULTISPECIES: hypothetical protein [Dyella]TBR36481.1 hypothetical protein EYV96_11085 [Dyella terrae]TCI08427.1 hypothetical protein EZM97_27785 [Dyella soli]